MYKIIWDQSDCEIHNRENDLAIYINNKAEVLEEIKETVQESIRNKRITHLPVTGLDVHFQDGSYLERLMISRTHQKGHIGFTYAFWNDELLEKLIERIKLLSKYDKEEDLYECK